MEIINLTGKQAVDSVARTLVIDEFDGVHKGHEVMLQTAKNHQQEHEKLAVLSFNIESRDIITSVADQKNILMQYGVEQMYQIKFTKEDPKLSAEVMMEKFASLNIKRIVIGEDYRFGNDVLTNTEEFIQLCKQVNIDVIVVSSVKENGRKISSNTIRHLIGEGLMEPAHSLMGRPYTITGTVIHGEKMGRKLGFPTINLGGVDDYAQPKPGIYLGVVGIHHDNVVTEYWHVLISAGYRPTVNGKGYLIEAHLLNYSGDLYGKKVSVSFLRYMRDEIKFTDLDALIQQMEQDKKDAEKLLDI